jgi:hypothetical protein
MKDILAFPSEHMATVQRSGMTLRDYFAARAMQGFCSLPADFESDRDSFEMTAKIAYEQADAMLKARDAAQ